MRKECNYSQGAIEWRKERFEELGISTAGKTILSITANLWYPFSGEIIGAVEVVTKDGERANIKPTKVRRPYPNRGVCNISFRQGRSYSCDIPLIFDNLEELSKIKQIKINWDIKNKVPGIFTEAIDLFIREIYDISFTAVEGCDFYMMKTQRAPWEVYTITMDDDDKVKKHMSADLDEFENVFLCYSETNEMQHYKNSKLQENPDCDKNMRGLLQACSGETTDKYKLYYFNSPVNLLPLIEI